MNSDNSTPETITIPLTKGQSTIIDLTDADLMQFKWRAGGVGPKTDYYYAVRGVKDGVKKVKTMLMHRLIMERVLGRELLRSEYVDHIDMCTLNNSRNNLRIATPAQNQHNVLRRSDNSSGYKGVHFRTREQKWAAVVQLNGKRVYLGYFDTPEAAYQAYCSAAKELHGEFYNPG